MRIAYLSPSGKLGGAERVLLDVLTNLRESHPHWDLRLVVATPGALADRAALLGVQVSILPFPPRLAALGESVASRSRHGRIRVLVRLARAAVDSIRYGRVMRRQLTTFAPDVVHSNGLKMHVIASWACPRGAAVIWHLHDYIGLRFISGRLLRLRARRCAAVIAISESVAQDARRVLGGGVSVSVVPNGVDIDAFSPQGRSLDLDMTAGLPPAPAGTIKIGLIASLAPWKGHDVFLRAMAELPPGVAVRGYVVGGPLYDSEGSERSVEDVKGQARRLGLEGRIGFVGFVDDVAAVMRGLDVVVHASTQAEPFGRVIVEAMSTGRPIIVSFAGGARDIVEPDATALVHAPGDWRGLRDGIVRLATDAALRGRLGKASRAAAVGRFDRRRTSPPLEAIYRRLVPSALEPARVLTS